MCHLLQLQVGDLSSRLLGAEVERDAALFDIKKFETDIQMLQKYSGGLVDQMMEKDAIIARLEVNIPVLYHLLMHQTSLQEIILLHPAATLTRMYMNRSLTYTDFAYMQNDNDILATTVSSMSDGHAGMKEIMPEIKKGVNETMAAVDTMVKTTKNVKFANEKDVVRCARDQQVAATKVKVCMAEVFTFLSAASAVHPQFKSCFLLSSASICRWWCMLGSCALGQLIFRVQSPGGFQQAGWRAHEAIGDGRPGRRDQPVLLGLLHVLQSLRNIHENTLLALACFLWLAFSG